MEFEFFIYQFPCILVLQFSWIQYAAMVQLLGSLGSPSHGSTGFSHWHLGKQISGYTERKKGSEGKRDRESAEVYRETISLGGVGDGSVHGGDGVKPAAALPVASTLDQSGFRVVLSWRTLGCVPSFPYIVLRDRGLPSSLGRTPPIRAWVEVGLRRRTEPMEIDANSNILYLYIMFLC